MPKKLIAVDLDDVLSFTAAGWIAFTNETWGMNLAADDYDEDWVKVWDVPLKEALQRRDVVYNSGLIGRLTHNREAKAVLTKLAEKYSLIVITSRLKIVEAETQRWLDKHFNGIFDKVTFTGFYDNNSQDSIKFTKDNLLKKLGADYLIDDQPKHCISAASAGMKSLLFGEYSWNKTVITGEGLTRVKNWSEVMRYFDGKS